MNGLGVVKESRMSGKYNRLSIEAANLQQEGVEAVSTIRKIAKSCAVLILGRECKPRRVLRGLASGYRMIVSPTDRLSYLVGTYEPHLQKAIRKYVRRGDTAYDVGANLGYISLSLAKQVGPDGQIAAFEPIPQNADVLRKNIANNGLSNVRVFDVAASDRKGEAVIRIAGGNFATSSMVWHKKNSAAEELVIKTVAIDDLVKNGELAEPAFVKIDVEGAEGLALKGMQQTVAQSRPVLFIESSEAGRETTWQLLRELDYRCRSAITGKWVDGFEEYRHSDFLWFPAGHREVSKNGNV
jgi:FkbM family methyltransferase